MALGGYKFAGYKCNRGETTDLQWVLLCHKTRVKAFLSSSSSANAGWTFDPDFTSGMYSYGTSGNVIYSMDELGYNLVSFFKHGDGDSYFAILTLGYYQASQNLASGCVKINTPTVFGSLSYRVGNGCTMFCKVSKTQITPSDVLDRVNGELYMMPCGKFLQDANYNNGPKPTTWENDKYTYLGLSGSYSVHAGFAIKGINIISFMGYAASGLCISCFSSNAFSSVFNDGDIYTQFALNAMASTSGVSNNERDNKFPTGSLSTEFGVYVLTINGDALSSTNNPTLVFRGVAYVAGNMSLPLMSYDSLVVDNIYAWDSTHNSGGKGIVSIDFLAYNVFTRSQDLPAAYAVVANGNYMCASNVTSTSLKPYPLNKLYTTSSGPKFFPVLYIGWDPSNPDITQESAWTEYTE